MPATNTERTATTSKTASGKRTQARTHPKTSRQLFAEIRIEFFTDGSHEVSLSDGCERLSDGRFEGCLNSIYTALGEARLMALNRRDFNA